MIDTKIDLVDDEFAKVIKFLKNRYKQNSLKYGNCFACEQNNEAAREMAAILFTRTKMKKADDLLSLDK